MHYRFTISPYIKPQRWLWKKSNALGDNSFGVAPRTREKSIGFIGIKLQPLSKWGLGLGKLEDLNFGLLVKWWWRYKVETNRIWRSVIKAIHVNSGCWTSIPCNKYIRGTWKSIANLNASLVKANLSLTHSIMDILGNGETLRFWSDHWIGSAPLMVSFPALFRIESDKACLVWDRCRMSEVL